MTTPVYCLTIAGSDSSAGAGLQADMQTFADFDCRGLNVCTVVTAQTEKRFIGAEALSPEIVVAQLRNLLDEYDIAAVKIGMLYRKNIIEGILPLLKEIRVPIIWDPLLVSSSGSALLEPAAKDILMTEGLPLATVITPNIPEAQVLLADTGTELAHFIQSLQVNYDCVYLKGGHDADNPGTDYLIEKGNIKSLTLPVLPAGIYHGTGCRFSSALAAGLARGNGFLEAASAAKKYVHTYISQVAGVGSSAELIISDWQAQ